VSISCCISSCKYSISTNRDLNVIAMHVPGLARAPPSRAPPHCYARNHFTDEPHATLLPAPRCSALQPAAPHPTPLRSSCRRHAARRAAARRIAYCAARRTTRRAALRRQLCGMRGHTWSAFESQQDNKQRGRPGHGLGASCTAHT
jgi:hypothetical protein